MGFFDRLTKHQGLFGGMTERLGADVSSIISATPERAGEYRSAVLNCALCGAAEACQSWQEQTESAETAPDFCRNKRWLEAIATR